MYVVIDKEFDHIVQRQSLTAESNSLWTKILQICLQRSSKFWNIHIKPGSREEVYNQHIEHMLHPGTAITDVSIKKATGKDTTKMVTILKEIDATLIYSLTGECT